MKQRIKDGFLYFVYVLGAEYIGLLVAGVSFIVTKFFTPDHWHISLFIGANIGAIIAVYILCRRCGYKEADEGYKFTFKETIPFIIGIIVYILLNVITNYRNPSFFNSDFLAFLVYWKI